MKSITVFFCLFITLFCIFSFSASAQTPLKKSPHDTMPMKTGVITGRLLKDGKERIGDYPITLEIMRGDELILTIPKMTGPEGEFRFMNIFRSPDFSYVVSTNYDGHTYRTDTVSLGKEDEIRKLDLNIAAGMECDTCKIMQKSINEYQILAILLSAAAVGYVIVQRKREIPPNPPFSKGGRK